MDSSSSSGAGNTATYTGFTTTTDNTILFSLVGTFSMPAGGPTGYTTINSDGWATLMAEDMQATAGATGSPTSVVSSGWITFFIGINPD